MTPFTLAATYIIVWWIVLFMALPIGIKPSADQLGRGQMAGAPEKPMLMKKIVWTSIVAAVLTAGIGYASQFDLPVFGFGPPVPASQ
ncbi:MAG: DUF1467 family protein [Rhodospirillales bacterium]|nr:DUF1467 family protein [Rhodospirillales bacterium]